MEDKLVLLNNLKKIRTEKRMSQSALADAVGVSRNTISSIEVGQYSPTAKLAYALCIALDKRFEDVFYFDGFRPHYGEACTEAERDDTSLTDRAIQRMKEYLSGRGWSDSEILDLLIFITR